MAVLVGQPFELGDDRVDANTIVQQGEMVDMGRAVEVDRRPGMQLIVQAFS
ncbi:hypothetical protein D9M68_910990 [compost metagenome]